MSRYVPFKLEGTTAIATVAGRDGGEVKNKEPKHLWGSR
jgi:hypothetical protein